MEGVATRNPIAPRAPRSAGVGLRLPHLAEVAATSPSAAWLEIHPENFMANPHAGELLQSVAHRYPISVHTVGISIGSVDGIDRAHLARSATRRRHQSDPSPGTSPGRRIRAHT
jgi:uncharacterized protein (UPF0276 family)